jgi:hypothetical protein
LKKVRSSNRAETLPNNSLHPTRLSRLDFDIAHVVVSDSDQSGTSQSRPASEANR